MSEFKGVFDIAEISNFNEDELRKYEAIMKYEAVYNATIAYADKSGFGRGVIQTARSMLKDGLTPARVARITQLPKEQVIALR